MLIHLNRPFSDATFILPRKIDVYEANHNKLRSLNCPIAKIHAVHTGRDAPKADSNTEKDLEAHLLLARGARFILRANLWTDAGLVNGSMRFVQEILFKEAKDHNLFQMLSSSNLTIIRAQLLQLWKAKSLYLCDKRGQQNQQLVHARNFLFVLRGRVTVHKSQGLNCQRP